MYKIRMPTEYTSIRMLVACLSFLRASLLSVRDCAPDISLIIDNTFGGLYE